MNYSLIIQSFKILYYYFGRVGKYDNLDSFFSVSNKILVCWYYLTFIFYRYLLKIIVSWSYLCCCFVLWLLYVAYFFICWKKTPIYIEVRSFLRPYFLIWVGCVKVWWYMATPFLLYIFFTPSRVLFKKKYYIWDKLFIIYIPTLCFFSLCFCGVWYM